MYNIDSLPKDILIEIAIELDLPDIVKWCSINKRINSLTGQNETFWMCKFIHDYGNYSKNSDLTWKEFYKLVTITKPNDLLWKGVKENVLSYVVVALKRGADIEHEKQIRFYIYNPLSLASTNGHLKVVKYLVKQGANVRTKDDSALGLASENGHLEVLKYLVEHGADVRANNDLPLRLASENGHLEVLKYLVEHGAIVRSENDYALRSSSAYGHLEVVKYLVGRGADVHAENDSALRLAKYYEHFGVVDYLKSLP